MLNHLRTHIEELGRQHDVELKWRPWTLPVLSPDGRVTNAVDINYHAREDIRCVSIPEIENTQAYYIALHELGHLVAPSFERTAIALLYESILGLSSPERLINECVATTWAYAHALVWDGTMLNLAQHGLRGYMKSVKQVPPLHALAVISVNVAEATLEGLEDAEPRAFTKVKE